MHHAAIQKADMEAWGKFEKAGTEINRLPVEDLEKFQRIAVPIWFKWANKDKDAARIFKLQLEVMEFAELRLCRRPTCTRARSSIFDDIFGARVALELPMGERGPRRLLESHDRRD